MPNLPPLGLLKNADLPFSWRSSKKLRYEVQKTMKYVRVQEDIMRRKEEAGAKTDRMLVCMASLTGMRMYQDERPQLHKVTKKHEAMFPMTEVTALRARFLSLWLHLHRIQRRRVLSVP